MSRLCQNPVNQTADSRTRGICLPESSRKDIPCREIFKYVHVLKFRDVACFQIVPDDFGKLVSFVLFTAVCFDVVWPNQKYTWKIGLVNF